MGVGGFSKTWQAAPVAFWEVWVGAERAAPMTLLSAQCAGQILCSKMWCQIDTKNCSQGVGSMGNDLYVLGKTVDEEL